MSITAYSQVRIGNVTRVTVTSDLSAPIYYHWYLNGSWSGVTTGPGKSFHLGDGDQARIEAIDTNDPAYDGIANAPDGWPARRTIWWCRSVDSDVVRYRVEQQKDGGDWSTLGTVQAVAGQWPYSLLTGRLDDLATYAWRVYPVDAAGNDGTALTLDSEKIVRTPDGPDFAIAFDDGTTKVTFSAAA